MEFVRGESITRYCDDKRLTAAPPSNCSGRCATAGGGPNENAPWWPGARKKMGVTGSYFFALMAGSVSPAS